jgi:triosephosphate isomerase
VGRKPYVAGNWKMHLDRAGAVALASAVAERCGGVTDRVDVGVCPTHLHLDAVAAALRSAGAAGVRLGTQDLYPGEQGAFTGEVSAWMLRDLGVATALTGHSERRHVLGETDAIVRIKTLAALEGGLECVLCVGETLEQREAGETDAVNERQVRAGLEGVTPGLASGRLVIAYEPVWAIGTGKTASGRRRPAGPGEDPRGAGRRARRRGGRGDADPLRGVGEAGQRGGPVRPARRGRRADRGRVAQARLVRGDRAGGGGGRRGVIGGPRGHAAGPTGSTTIAPCGPASMARRRPEPRGRLLMGFLALAPYVVGILVVLFVVVSIMMMLVVLIQRPSGGGLSGAFGAASEGAGQTAFGARTGDALTTATIVIFVIFILFAIGLNYTVEAPQAPVNQPAAETGAVGGPVGAGAGGPADTPAPAPADAPAGDDAPSDDGDAVPPADDPAPTESPE